MVRKLAALIALMVVLAACTQPPQPLAVTSVTPADEATAVPVDTVASAIFNQALRSQTVAEAFTLATDDGTEVAGEVTYNPSERQATFTPSDPLAYETTYTATLSTDLRSSAGSALRSAYTWSFTTAAQPETSVVSVSITGGDRTIEEGDTEQLTATVDYGDSVPGNNTVTWASDNEAIATVSETGLVTAVAAGTAIITATSTENTEQSDSITITVEAAPPVTIVEGVSIDGGDRTIEVGDTEQLTATVDYGTSEPGNNTVTWESSDEAVATIDPETGLVEAIDAGTAIITATSTENTEQSDSITITVVEAPSVASVTITADDPSIMVVGDTLDLAAVTDVVVTGGASQALTWASADLAIAAVSTEGVVEALAVGTTTITATAVDDTSVSDEIVVDVSQVNGVTIDGPATLYLLEAETLGLVGAADVDGNGSTDVDWASSDPESVSVDETGSITVLAASVDPVIITATSVLDPTQEVSVTVYALAELLAASDDYASYAGPADVTNPISIAAPAVTGGVGSLTYALVAGDLPDPFTTEGEEDPAVTYEITLDGTSGTISGSTGYPGTFTGTVEITDEIGQVATAEFELDLSLFLRFTDEELEDTATEFPYQAGTPVDQFVIPGDRVQVSGVGNTADLPSAFHAGLAFTMVFVEALNAANAPVATTEEPFVITVEDGTVEVVSDPAVDGIVRWVYDITLTDTATSLTDTVRVEFYEDATP